MEEFYTTPELARRLKRKARTIQDWRVRGVGPRYIRLGGGNGGKVLYRVSDVEAWLAQHEAMHTAEEAART